MNKNPYSRFYGLLARLPLGEDDVKEQLVLQYTAGRTDSLRAMKQSEYDEMCDALEGSIHSRELLRNKRSEVLRLMQRLGIDTTDWSRINAFCRDSRIAGKEFGALKVAELSEVATKLRAIERNGGLRRRAQATQPQSGKPKQLVLCVPSFGLLS